MLWSLAFIPEVLRKPLLYLKVKSKSSRGWLAGQGLTNIRASNGYQGCVQQIISQVSGLRQHTPSVRMDKVVRGYRPHVATGWEHHTVGSRDH